MRESRQQHVDVVLKRVTGSTISGREKQPGLGDGKEGEQVGAEEEELDKGKDGIQSVDIGMDISEGHAVWG
jgi:hypothetical protein